MPRFLFRGFKSSSGGNAKLNRGRLILPHAFSDTSSTVEAWPWDDGGKSVDDITTAKLEKDVVAHLSGIHVNTHFTSWAADFSTALQYAGNSKSAMIAVIDTAYCTPQTAVCHVPALHAAGIAHGPFPHEYLVYGPFLGAAYCCSVSVQDIRKAGRTPYGFDLTTSTNEDITAKDMECAKKVDSFFQHEVFEIAGPDLFLTVFAAELSRQKLPSVRHGHMDESSWSLRDTQAVIRCLSDRIEDAALCNVHPLVNFKTYVTYFPQLRGMVDLLMAVNSEIARVRSEWMEKVRPREDSQMMQMTPRPTLKRKDRPYVAVTGSKMLGPRDTYEDTSVDKHRPEASTCIVDTVLGTKPRPSRRGRPAKARSATKSKGHSAIKSAKRPVYDHPEPFFIAGKKEWKVDCFLASRVKNGRLQYQVRWQGWEPDPKFYPAANFKGTPNLLKLFQSTHPNSDGPPMLLENWINAWEHGGRAPSHPDDHKVLPGKRTASA